MPTKQSNYFDKHPNVLKKSYTADEIARIEQRFRADPAKHSKEYGNLIICRMHQKSPEFALEFAQTPEIADGINAQEAKAMGSIYGLIKGLDIPDGFFEKRIIDRYNLNILIEWESSSKGKSDWGCSFIPTDGFYRSGTTRIINAKPMGFEMGEDKITIDRDTGPTPQLSWQSQSTRGDIDGILITMTYPEDTVELSFYNGSTLHIKKKELLSKDNLLFDENDGLEGKLNIKKVGYKTGFAPELIALNEMILAGEGEHRYSSLLQALLWGYMDGKFKEGDIPLKNYQGAVEFVKPIWGEMDGQKWGDFDTVVSRLNTPVLLDYWEQRNLSYQYYIGSMKSDRSVFESKSANCKDTSEFTVYCLSKSGYDATLFWVESMISEGHIITFFEDKGNKFIMDNGKPSPKGLIGPIKSLSEAGYTIQGNL